MGDCIKFQGFLVEFLENRRSRENQKSRQNCQKRGLFWALPPPFTMHLVCTLIKGQEWDRLSRCLRLHHPDHHCRASIHRTRELVCCVLKSSHVSCAWNHRMLVVLEVITCSMWIGWMLTKTKTKTHTHTQVRLGFQNCLCSNGCQTFTGLSISSWLECKPWRRLKGPPWRNCRVSDRCPPNPRRLSWGSHQEVPNGKQGGVRKGRSRGEDKVTKDMMKEREREKESTTQCYWGLLDYPSTSTFSFAIQNEFLAETNVVKLSKWLWKSWRYSVCSERITNTISEILKFAAKNYKKITKLIWARNQSQMICNNFGADGTCHDFIVRELLLVIMSSCLDRITYRNLSDLYFLQRNHTCYSKILGELLS